MSFGYVEDRQDRANVIGSFHNDRNASFKASIRSTARSFEDAFSIDPFRQTMSVLESGQLSSQYIKTLLEDCNVVTGDPYTDATPMKLQQLMENSRLEILRESFDPAMTSPVVGLTLPILKKSFIEGHSKDIIPVEVPDKPVVKVAMERKFLVDGNGGKHYLPEVFYDERYKKIMAQGRGVKVNSEWSTALPLHEYDILTKSGGSMAKRDSLAYDFGIQAVKLQVGSNQKEVEVDITASLENQHTFTATVSAVNDDTKEVVEDLIFGQVDFYTGRVSVASSKGLVKSVQFKGHLSNINNERTVEISRERKIFDWNIPDGVRINTGLTLERIKDTGALLNIDLTAEAIADMAQVLAQTEDSDTLSYLNAEYDKWKGKTGILGYEEGFTREAWFTCEAPGNKMITTSEWIGSELKYYLNRFIDEMKVLLRNPDIMFVIYGHPNNVTLIQDDVNWIIDNDTTMGGVQLDYRFGVMTKNQNRIRVLSTLKCPRERGLRVVAYPLTQEIITFKQLKYSLTIDNGYRNPNTPLTPNIMGTSRYLTKSLLPVQGEFRLEDNLFGSKPKEPEPVTQKPTFSPANGSVTSVNKQVTITSATPNAVIYYTTDNTTPTTASDKINSGQKVTLSKNCTLKAIAIAPKHQRSEVTEAAFTV